MRRILVVAHKTLGGQHLLDEVQRRMKGGGVAIHLLVPVSHPMGAFTEASMEADAKQVLSDGLQQIRELDPTGSVDVTGEVGDPNPVYAVGVVMNRHDQVDEIIVSTLSSGAGKWLRARVPSRIAKAYDVPVFHVVADPTPART